MTNTDAGDNASSSARTPMSANVPSKPPISPAARKFAEYLKRRMVPQIEHAGRQSTTANQDQTNNR